jgi:sialidase-1
MKSILFAFLMFLTLSSLTCEKEEAIKIQSSASMSLIQEPLYLDNPEQSIANIRLDMTNIESTTMLKRIMVVSESNLKDNGNATCYLVYKGQEGVVELSKSFGTKQKVTGQIKFDETVALSKGIHLFEVRVIVTPENNLEFAFNLSKLTFEFEKEPQLTITPSAKYRFRPCLKLRKAGMDNCNTYRIPGLITTNSGALIAVYDNRYNNSKDLQEDIDIGMSRSTDGGQTWQAMKVIMDMGTWGGKPQNLNGIGDPCILYDHKTNTIWVAALWMNGSAPDKMLWWASNPGMAPTETGQFILSKSTDDGLTWSEPINITSQIKDPAWQLLLQGPGMGITLEDGTLVFPVQFKADINEKALDGGQYTCHSTIIYSKDQGKSWQIGKGAKSNTTEAQVVQLSNGSLMLNMRDDRNRKDKGETNGRAIATTTDLGKTWTTHPTSNSALQESNCMASIISSKMDLNGKSTKVLFFSNPNNKQNRGDMTIKASIDEGNTWPTELQLKLNAQVGYGYSCMTMVDNKTIGILYEGVKDMYFQKIPVSEIIVK